MISKLVGCCLDEVVFASDGHIKLWLGLYPLAPVASPLVRAPQLERGQRIARSDMMLGLCGSLGFEPAALFEGLGWTPAQHRKGELIVQLTGAPREVPAERGSASTSRGSNLDSLPIEHMTIQRMDHVGIVVNDLAAAIEFFVELGLVLQGEWSVEGRWVDRIVGLEGVRAEAAMLQTPDGHGRLELVKFHSPPTQGGNRHAPANTPGIRHIAFAVEDIDAVVAGLRARGAELVGELERYEDSYRLCYVRGSEGIIVELAEQIG